MGKSSYKIVIITVLASIALGLGTTCTKKSEFVFPPTKLQIQVFGKNKNGASVPMKGVRIGLFSDSAKYSEASWNYDFSKSELEQITDHNGYVYFDSISSNVKYYVLTKLDSVNVQGDTITWSNIVEDYQFLNPLKENTVTTAHVFISASDGFINFWTSNQFAQQQPIYVRNSVSGVLYDTVAIINNFNKTNGKKVKMRMGTYEYNAKSDYGCAWQGIFVVVPSETKDFELVACNMVRLTVGVSSQDKSKYPVRVVLNSNDTIAVLRAGLSSSSQIGCGMQNSISVARPSGNYSYQFIGNDNTVIVGTTKIDTPNAGIACDTLIVNF